MEEWVTYLSKTTGFAMAILGGLTLATGDATAATAIGVLAIVFMLGAKH